MADELEDLHRKASGHYLRGDLPAAMEVWREVLRLKPDDERAREGIRLCEQLEDGDGSGPAAEQPRSIAPSTLSVDRPPVFQSTAVQPPHEDGVGDPMRDMSPNGQASHPSIDPVAATELRRRTDSLLNEARALAGQGDTEGALSTLERVLILDDENEDALSLRASLEPPAQEPQADVPLLTPHLLEPIGQDLASPSPQPAPEASRSEPPDPQTAEPEPAAPPVATGSEAIVVDLLAKAEAEAKAAGAKARIKRLSMPSLPLWLQDRRVVIGAGSVLVVAVVCLVMGMFGRDDLPSPAPPAGRNTDAPMNQPTEPVAATEPIPDTAPVPDPEISGVAVLLLEAEAASQAEDYAAAVIAYDRVLKEQPGHATAVRNMKIVAQRYREQQRLQQQWDEAVAAFENQNFVEALRLFYRMPADEYEADIDGYKVNGWYNLGVASLQALDCERAAEHFREARSLAPEDPGVAVALELSVLCRGPAVRADVKRLRLRALND